MKIAIRSLLGLATLVLVVAVYQTPVRAQTAISALVTATCGTPGITLTPGRPGVVTQNNSGQLCVNATVSASISGFAPAGTFATITATNSSASVALPAGAVVAFQNTGTTAVSCTLGVGSATASASQNIIPGGSTVYFTVGANTFGACIDQTGSTSTVVALSGGAGLGTGFGGGGGGGSGGAVTLASGAVASGAYSAGSIAAGAFVSGSVLSGAYASGSLVDITNLSATTAGAVPAKAAYMGVNVGGNIVGLAPGTAGSAGSQVFSVQGIASMTPLLANPGTIGTWGLQASTQNSATPTNMALMAGQFNTTPTTITTGNIRSEE